MPGPLEGVKVLEWATFHNGPHAGYQLGDLGAEVIKIEEPVRGDGLRGMQAIQGEGVVLRGRLIPFETANRNKRGITLNLANERAREVFYHIVRDVDVFITNYRYSLLDRFKIDYETLRGHNPRLIYAVGSGYGPNGPDRDKRSYDLLGLARSGLMWAAGDRDSGEPFQIVGGIVDQMGATMLAYGIMAALVARQRLGVGQKVEASQLGAAVHLQSIGVDLALLRGRGFARHSRARSASVFANHYRCADGQWLALAEAHQDKYWPALCDALGVHGLEADPRFRTATDRRKNALEINEIMGRLFATRTRDDWMNVFAEKGCDFAYDRVQTVEELASDPMVLANRYVVDYEHPVLGSVKLLGFPCAFSATPARIQREAPEFGQHTEEVLQEYGYSWETIGELREQGAI